MSESREQHLEISHYLGDNNEFIGFFGYSDNVRLNASLYGKKIDKYGEATSYNNQLADAIENGLVDEDGNLTEKTMASSAVEEVAEPKGHVNFPKTDRSNSGNNPTEFTSPGFVDWLESGPGRHGIDVGNSLSRNVINKLWNIYLDISHDFEEDDVDIFRRYEILEQNSFISKNEQGDYQLTEKGKRKLDDLRKKIQTRSSLENKKRLESQRESDESVDRIKRALNGLKTVDSYTIVPSENLDDNLFEVSLNLTDGTEIKKTIEVNDETTLKEIRTKFVKLLKARIRSSKNK